MTQIHEIQIHNAFKKEKKFSAINNISGNCFPHTSKNTHEYTGTARYQSFKRNEILLFVMKGQAISI